MCVKNTHFKCLKSYYRDSRVKVTHLFLECVWAQKEPILKAKKKFGLKYIKMLFFSTSPGQIWSVGIFDSIWVLHTTI